MNYAENSCIVIKLDHEIWQQMSNLLHVFMW
jgi:hypothetical protein